MSVEKLKEDLHDIETHRDAWAKIVNMAAGILGATDEGYGLRAAAVEIERRSEDFTRQISEANADDALLAADKFIELTPYISKSIAVCLHSGERLEEDDRSWLEHEKAALAHLLTARANLVEDAPSP